MSWIFSAGSEGSALGLSGRECERLGSARSILSAERSWPRDFQGDLFGETCEPSPPRLWPTPNATDAINRSPERHFQRQASLKARNPNLGELQMPLQTAVLMSSAGAFPASRSALPASALVNQTSDGYGRSLPVSLARLDR